jgi:hypothetical protein
MACGVDVFVVASSWVFAICCGGLKRRSDGLA